MALRWCLVILLAVAGLRLGTARADHQPVIVIPGTPGVPVIVDGQEVSGAIVIGEWGLYRPGHVAPTVIYRRPWVAEPPHWHRPAVVRHYRYKRVRTIRRKVTVVPARRHFFPGGTTPPKLGRHESNEPANPPPVPAENFNRSWSAKSAPSPATIGQPSVVNAPIVVQRRPRPKPAPPKPAP